MNQNTKYIWFLITGAAFMVISLVFFPFLRACEKKSSEVTTVSSSVSVVRKAAHDSSSVLQSMNNHSFVYCANVNDVNAIEPNWPHPRSKEFVKQRRLMVRYIRDHYQLKDKKVLKALQNVPRHWFVPEDMVSLAYSDRPLPIGYGQTISQPFIVAYMTSQLKLEQDSKVLEIGTGSGYQAAVLNEFTPNVFTIEIVEKLAKATDERFKELGYTAIRTKIGDGYKGWPQYQPFDAIIVTAAPDDIPEELVRQLSPGGRMILPVGRTDESQHLMLITKDTEGKTANQKLLAVRFVPMVHGDSD